MTKVTILAILEESGVKDDFWSFLPFLGSWKPELAILDRSSPLIPSDSVKNRSECTLIALVFCASGGFIQNDRLWRFLAILDILDDS